MQNAGRNPRKAARLISESQDYRPPAPYEGCGRADTPSPDNHIPYRGRFAPSPTGALHFGSLVAAVASFLDARHHQGTWLVRIEDLDPPREKPGSADQILRTLEAFGLEWDGCVERQSSRFEAYGDATRRLLHDGHAYFCGCSRKDVALAGQAGIEGPVYPGTCRHSKVTEKPSRAVRLLTHDQPIAFDDLVFGLQRQRVESAVGDFVLRRADGLFAYQLAVVLDDSWQHITHVVRGADLLASTPRQIHLQQVLEIPRPSYAHIPLVLDAEGRKLSKSDSAHPVDPRKPRQTLEHALTFLGQPVPETDHLPEFWAEATLGWKPKVLASRPR